MKKAIVLITALAFCLTSFAVLAKSYKVGGVKYKVKEDKIIETSYGKKKYAKFFYKKPHVKKNKKMYIMGSVDVPGDSAPSRCQMAADLQAKIELTSELQSRFENQLQYAAEGFGIDQSSLTQIAMQSTKIDFIQGIFIDNRFWEKRLVQSGPDTYVKYTCYSRAVMPVKSFEEYANKILKGYEDEKKFSPEFEKKVNEAYDQFFKPVDVEDDKEYTVEHLESIQ